MAAYTFNGIVKEVMESQTFNSGFTKREFVVTTKEERYPQDIKFEAVQEKVSIVEGLKAGDDVTVTFDLRGNEYNGRYFVNLRAWKLEKESGGVSGGDDDQPPLPTDIPEDIVNADDEDLPF